MDRWPDFWIPVNGPRTRSVLETALKKARNSRVDITCGGGIGRTGTALACIAVLDGIDSASAVAFIEKTTTREQWKLRGNVGTFHGLRPHLASEGARKRSALLFGCLCCDMRACLTIIAG